MLIGVDGNEANVEQQVGVSVYTLNLLRYFQKVANEKRRFAVYLKSIPLPHLPEENKYFKYRVIKAPFLWLRFALPVYLSLFSRPNVFFAPAHYSPSYGIKKLVVTIHDLAYFYYPEEFLKKDLYKLRAWTKQSLQKANKVISVSKTTKKDLKKFYSLPENKVEVIYNGYDRESVNEHNFHLDKEEIKKNPYLLYLGTLQPRKNIPTLIEAFYKLQTEYPNLKLILAGKKGWLFDKIFKEVKDKEIEDKVIFTGFVNESDLQFLYENAICFVLPSRYEGFGIPVLEAMSYQCPVIASYKSSLPEVGGDACLYFNPETVNDLEEKIKLFLSDENLRTEYIEKGKKQIEHFSWENCGQQTLAVLESVNESNKVNNKQF
jgi:glycosyltransferase involved in cell wall biosynthesis